MPDIIADITTTERRRKFRISHEEMLAAIVTILNEPDIGLPALRDVDFDIGSIGDTEDLTCTFIVVQKEIQ